MSNTFNISTIQESIADILAADAGVGSIGNVHIEVEPVNENNNLPAISIFRDGGRFNIDNIGMGTSKSHRGIFNQFLRCNTGNIDSVRVKESTGVFVNNLMKQHDEFIDNIFRAMQENPTWGGSVITSRPSDVNYQRNLGGGHIFVTIITLEITLTYT